MKNAPIKIMSMLLLSTALTGCSVISNLLNKSSSSTKLSKYSNEVTAEEFSNEMMNSVMDHKVLSNTDVADYTVSLNANASLDQKITNSKFSNKNRGSLSAEANGEAKLVFDKDNQAAELTAKVTAKGKMETPLYGTQNADSKTEWDFVAQNQGENAVALVNKKDKTYMLSQLDEDDMNLVDTMAQLKALMTSGAYYLANALSSIPEDEAENLKLYHDGDVFTAVYHLEQNKAFTAYDSKVGSYVSAGTSNLNAEIKVQLDLGKEIKVRGTIEATSELVYDIDCDSDRISGAANLISLNLTTQRSEGDVEKTTIKGGATVSYVEKSAKVSTVNLSSYKEVQELF